MIFQALNQLFEKIIALDVDERHLLRLGHGEEELETEKDFSRLVIMLLACDDL
jgi:intron-binding protein aquarius